MTDTARFDRWILIYVFTTAFASYFGKVAVRVDLQTFGFAVPSIAAPILAMVATFALDLISYNTAQMQGDSDSGFDEYAAIPYDFWGYFDYRYWGRSPDPAALIMYFIVLGLGTLSLGILTSYIWKNESWTYPLERDVFVLPSYRAVSTSVFNLLNRRTIDLEAELQSEEFKKYNTNSRQSRYTRASGRQTGRLTTKTGTMGGKKTTIWDKGQVHPYIFICTTLWHEEDFEMKTLLRSVVKLLRHARKKVEKNDPNLYHLEMHIFFDNVFVHKTAEKDGQDDFINATAWTDLNDWVIQFQRVFKEVLNQYGDKTYLNARALKEGKIIRTPYGGRVEYKIAGYPFIIHLKDAEKVQRGKRWSQVMYLYYLIGWKMDACRLKTDNRMYVQKEKSFILALDGDVDFDPPAFELVLDRCMRNDKVAACCGQIHPTGSGWLVAYQNFEYAVGHWLQKSAEHVLGCVLCSPGCFSLMRISYLNNPNVMAMYKSLAQDPMEKLQYDQGEDRWLCTLMLFSGGRIEYEGSSHCNTFAPEDLGTFYKQRRRWGPSTTANIWNMVKESKRARKNNPYISFPYVLYQFMVLIFSVIGVSTTIMMVAEALSLGVGGVLSRGICYTIVLVPVIIFTMACYISGDGDLQLSLATWFSLGFSFIMACVFIGLIIEGIHCPLSPSFLFFAAMAFIHVVGALLHGDLYAIICGVIYFLFIPSCFIFLQIYSISNLNDCSWGTRQAKKVDTGVKKTFYQRLFGKTEEQIAKEGNEDLEGTNCTCVLCLDSRYEVVIKEEVLDQIRKKKGGPVTEEPVKVIEEPKKETAKDIRMARASNRFRPSEQFLSRPSNMSMASIGSKGTFLGGTRDTIAEYNMNPIRQEELEDKGFMLGNIDRGRKTIMTDETGMNEIIVDGEFEKDIKTERLYGGFQIRKLRMIDQDDWQLYLVNPKTGRDCYQPRPQGDANIMKLGDVRDREIKNYKVAGGAEYLSWAIGSKSPFDKRCKVYTLSNPEQDFWDTMQDPSDGYIGIRTKGRDFQKIKEHEAWLAEEMGKFRDEKFMYYIFINVMWIIVSCVILKYSWALLQIKIPIPPDIAKSTGCGVFDEDAEESADAFLSYQQSGKAYFIQEHISRNFSRRLSRRDIDPGEDGDDEDVQTYLILQPFSLFFLFIYIIIIFVQFFCMLWHRLSTLYHYIAYIDVASEREEAIEKIQERKRIITAKKEEKALLLDDFDDEEADDWDDLPEDDEFGTIVYQQPSLERATLNEQGSDLESEADGGKGIVNIVPIKHITESTEKNRRITGVVAKGLVSQETDELPLITDNSITTPYASLATPYQQLQTDKIKHVRMTEQIKEEAIDSSNSSMIEMDDMSPKSSSNEDEPELGSVIIGDTQLNKKSEMEERDLMYSSPYQQRKAEANRLDTGVENVAFSENPIISDNMVLAASAYEKPNSETLVNVVPTVSNRVGTPFYNPDGTPCETNISPAGTPFFNPDGTPFHGNYEDNIAQDGTPFFNPDGTPFHEHFEANVVAKGAKTQVWNPDGTAFHGPSHEEANHGVFDQVKADFEKEKNTLKAKYEEFQQELSKIAKSASRDTLNLANNLDITDNFDYLLRNSAVRSSSSSSIAFPVSPALSPTTQRRGGQIRAVSPPAYPHANPFDPYQRMDIGNDAGSEEV